MRIHHLPACVQLSTAPPSVAMMRQWSMLLLVPVPSQFVSNHADTSFPQDLPCPLQQEKVVSMTIYALLSMTDEEHVANADMLQYDFPEQAATRTKETLNLQQIKRLH